MIELQPNSKPRTVLGGTALVWLGLLLGVSFLATPAKFLAPSLSLAVALDVGRQTFLVFNRTEWLLVVVLAVVWAVTSRARGVGVLVAIVLVIVLAETLWLLPVLDLRVQVILNGEVPSPSSHHTWYIALETGKAIALLLIGICALRRASSQ